MPPKKVERASPKTPRTNVKRRHRRRQNTSIFPEKLFKFLSLLVAMFIGFAVVFSTLMLSDSLLEYIATTHDVPKRIVNAVFCFVVGAIVSFMFAYVGVHDAILNRIFGPVEDFMLEHSPEQTPPRRTTRSSSKKD